MLQQDISRTSTSAYRSPVWIIPYKVPSGKRKLRIVIYYRKLNDKSIDDKNPINKELLQNSKE